MILNHFKLPNLSRISNCYLMCSKKWNFLAASLNEKFCSVSACSDIVGKDTNLILWSSSHQTFFLFRCMGSQWYRLCNDRKKRVSDRLNFWCSGTFMRATNPHLHKSTHCRDIDNLKKKSPFTNITDDDQRASAIILRLLFCMFLIIIW